MKTILAVLDEFISVIPWIIVAWLILGFATMAVAQELTEEQDIVVQTILGEARSEGEIGMYAVACIIKQRVINRKQSAKKVCLAESQFDYWTKRKSVKWDDQNRANVRRLIIEDKAKVVKYAKRLAIYLNDLDRGFTKNADHYCTLSTHNYWTRKNKPVKIIGKHKFFKLN